METGKGKLEDGKWKLGVPVSSFHFPLSGFSVLAAPAWLDFVPGPPDT
jgi:hypothetical protein